MSAIPFSSMRKVEERPIPLAVYSPTKALKYHLVLNSYSLGLTFKSLIRIIRVMLLSHLIKRLFNHLFACILNFLYKLHNKTFSYSISRSELISILKLIPLLQLNVIDARHPPLDHTNFPFDNENHSLYANDEMITITT